MDFDNLQSVSSVIDTLPYEAVSITGRDAPEGSGILEETDMIGLPIPTLLKDWAQTHPKNNPDPLY
jgi:phage-related holin